MKKTTVSLAVAGFVAAAATSQAAYEFNENLSVEGYAIGSYLVSDPDNTDPAESFLNGDRLYDSALLALNGKVGALSGKVSAVYFPGRFEQNYANDVGIRDAYVTFTAGEFAITAGKFNTVLGYESTDAPSNYFADYSSSYYAGGYHSGAKVDYTAETWGAGFAAVDSVNSVSLQKSIYQGDGDFKNDLGYEAYVSFSGVDKLTVWTGVGFENTDGQEELFTYVVWAQYNATEQLTFAAEYTYYKDNTNYSWQALANYAFTEHISAAVRLSGAEYDDGVTSDELKYSFGPAYKFNEYFSLRGVLSLTAKESAPDVLFYGVQGILKF